MTTDPTRSTNLQNKDASGDRIPVGHIETQTVSGVSDVQFTSGIDSTFSVYKFYIYGLTPATDGNELHLTHSTDGGTSYEGDGAESPYDYATKGQRSTGDDRSRAAEDASFIRLDSDGVGNDPDDAYWGEITMFEPANGSNSTAYNIAATVGDGFHFGIAGGGRDVNARATDAVRFAFSGSNVQEGTIVLRGVV